MEDNQFNRLVASALDSMHMRPGLHWRTADSAEVSWSTTVLYWTKNICTLPSVPYIYLFVSAWCNIYIDSHVWILKGQNLISLSSCALHVDLLSSSLPLSPPLSLFLTQTHTLSVGCGQGHISDASCDLTLAELSNLWSHHSDAR